MAERDCLFDRSALCGGGGKFILFLIFLFSSITPVMWLSHHFREKSGAITIS